MVAVIFEVTPHAGQRDAYLDAAARLKPLLEQTDGFVSVERFESLSQPGKLLSLQFWRDEEAVRRWRNLEIHRRVQQAGRRVVFADYRLQVAQVVRSYGKFDRSEAPADSRAVHDLR
jgi:heme-degrading monooxygenase HmoA